ncbi:MAG: alpha-amylase family glycosyl hydrolase, partial [Calditrichia bacterium]
MISGEDALRAGVDFQLQEGEIVFTSRLAEGDYNIRYYQDINNPGRIVNQPLSDGFFSYLDARPGAYFYYPVADSNETVISKQNILINNRGYHQIQFLDFSASPNWARDAIIYLLYVRKFSGEGTINGVIGQLDYLKTLGVSCLWLMPVMESSTPNGYAPTDFFSIEKDYGTLQDYQHLIQELHKRDMRIIFDFIANHTSNQHPFFISSWRNPNSPFRDWYVWKSDKEYAFHNTWDQLPNFNYNNPNVRNYILKAAKLWIDQGIDGLRCDVAWAVPHNFWKDFRRRVKAWNPQLLLIDEVLPGQPAYHDQEFDMSYDSDFYGGLLDYFKGNLPLPGLIFRIKKHHLNYPPQAQALRYLETQDLPRFIKQFGKEKTRLATALLLTLPGTPLIYYGQETGLSEQRPPMKFNRQQNKYFRFYRKLIGLRRDNPELRSQSLEFLENSAPEKVLT